MSFARKNCLFQSLKNIGFFVCSSLLNVVSVGGFAHVSLEL